VKTRPVEPTIYSRAEFRSPRLTKERETAAQGKLHDFRSAGNHAAENVSEVGWHHTDLNLFDRNKRRPDSISLEEGL
jgi:hypothetical protein